MGIKETSKKTQAYSQKDQPGGHSPIVPRLAQLDRGRKAGKRKGQCQEQRAAGPHRAAGFWRREACWSPGPAETSDHKWGDFKPQDLILWWSWRPKVRVQAVSRAVLPPRALGEIPSLSRPAPHGPGVPWLANISSPSLCLASPLLVSLCVLATPASLRTSVIGLQPRSPG